MKEQIDCTLGGSSTKKSEGHQGERGRSGGERTPSAAPAFLFWGAERNEQGKGEPSNCAVQNWGGWQGDGGGGGFWCFFGVGLVRRAGRGLGRSSMGGLPGELKGATRGHREGGTSKDRRKKRLNI